MSAFAPELPAPALATLCPVLSPENVSAARIWLTEAMLTVETVFPAVNWGRDTPPAVQDAFDDALAARFFGGVISDDDFKAAWRAYYRSCL